MVYAPAIALEAVTGLPKVGSVFAIGFVCTFYSTMGGLKAVLATDVFQALLMMSSLIIVFVGGWFQLDGLENVLELSEDRLQLFDFNPDPTVRHTFWTQVIGATFVLLSMYAVNQAQIQRLLSTRTLKEAQISLWIQWPIHSAMMIMTGFAGLICYAYYKGCDPIKLERIGKGDQILPLFVMDTMSDYPGVVGLFISGILSGCLSTVSSAINSLAAITMEDYLKPFLSIKESNETFLLKMVAMIYGLTCILLTFIVEYLGPGILQASITIFGVVGGPILGLFSLGMMTTRANEKGALTGFFSALVFLLWIGFGYPKPPAEPLPSFANRTNCGTDFNQTEVITMENEVESETEYFFLYSISYSW